MQFSFIGGQHGAWRVTEMLALRGEGLAPVDGVDIVEGFAPASAASWQLRGVVSNLRYAEKDEVERLKAIQPVLGRTEARCAALIPIRKSAAWWALAQDERRAIFERDSMHTQIGLEYLPAVARKLHHCRDLGEPFDFLTWFEFAPEHSKAFDELLARLRDSLEWSYVEREAEVRLLRV
ncbi:MAG TPA: chlorite dismutase family protein [Rhodocyclaceae bacterium]